MTSKKIKERLEKYAPKVGKTYDALEKEYTDYTDKAKLKYPDLTGDKLANKAIDLLINAYRRKHGDIRYSKAKIFEGWIDGATPLRDQVQEKIRRAAYLVKKDGREACILQEIIDENGVPIDDRPNIFGRRKNPNFGKPLIHASPTYLRTIYGVARPKGTQAFKSFQMTFFEEAAKALDYRTNLSCEFSANPGKTPSSLYGNNKTKFYPINTDWDMDEIYQKIVVPCEELETRMISQNWDDRDVRLRVDVININTTAINDRGDRVMGVADDSIPLDSSITCFIPAHVEMKFGQDSKVIVLGRARPYKGSPSLNIYGIWPIPGETTFVEVADLDEGEIVDVGWVELEEDINIDDIMDDDSL